jgi:DNA-binding response OmpR family regulator
MLPGLDGWELIETVRGEGIGTPIVVVSARGTEGDRIRALELGADDYLVKPFSLLELEARLRAVLRRPGTREAPKLACGALLYDPAAREVTVRGQSIEMSRRESDLLEALLRAVGRVVIRDFLEEQLYSFNEPVTPNALEAVVSRLRRRLISADAGVRIETRRGIGYRLVAEREDASTSP